MKIRLHEVLAICLVLLLAGCAMTTAEDALKNVDLSQKQDKACIRQCLNTHSKCIGSSEAWHPDTLASVSKVCASTLKLCADTCE
jgi:hypothetical protein